MQLPLDTTPTVTVAIGGVDRTFARLLAADWKALQDALMAKQRGSIDMWGMMLRKQGLGVELIPELIRKLEQMPTFAEVWRFAESVEGMIVVLKLAAKRAGWELTDEILNGIGTAHRMQTLAGDLANLYRPDVPASDEPKEAKDISPLAGTSPTMDGETLPDTSDVSFQVSH